VCLQNTSGAGDEPCEVRGQYEEQQQDDSGLAMADYYRNFARKMASRHSYDYVDDVVKALKLPDLTNARELAVPLSEGDGGDVYDIRDQDKRYVLKIYKSGVSPCYTQFLLDLHKHMDDPEAKAHPGYAAVYFAALPVGWASYMGKKGLVFRYVMQPHRTRTPTADDRAQVRDQIEFLHWLGYVHLDITDRNVMLADQDRCYLMDYDCVCKIGSVPHGPLPMECTETVLTRRHPAQLSDDDHLWQFLQTTLFKGLPREKAKLVSTEVKQQQAAGEDVVIGTM